MSNTMTLDFSLPSLSTNFELSELINHNALKGGKRIRPLLCQMFGQIAGCSEPALSTLSRAAELVHTASLIHDDIIDEAKVRRLRKTLREQTSNAHAVLAGDHLIAVVLKDLAILGCTSIIEDLALALERLTHGEWLQLESRGLIDITDEHLLRIAKLKTSSLIEWAVKAPLLYTQQSSDVIESAVKYAQEIGIAFQLVDDTLDFSPAAEKDYAKDIQEGLVNSVSRYALKQNPKLGAVILRTLGTSDVSELREFQHHWRNSIEQIHQKAVCHYESALYALGEVEKHFLTEHLRKRLEIFEEIRRLSAHVILREN